MATPVRIDPEHVPARVATAFDRVMSVQRPVVLAHIRSLRKRRPTDSPALVLRSLERRYLAAITAGGAAVGASAAIPAVGTGTSLALSGVETAGFLEASALYAQSVTELHGISVDDPERARTLVMALMLGSSGQDLLKQFTGEAAGQGKGRRAYWGEFITRNLPNAAFGPVADRIQAAFIRRFAVTQGASVAGRLVPFGIGAIIGGAGNHIMGRAIIRSSHAAFGPPPAAFPISLDAVVKPPKPLKPPKAPKAPKDPKAPRQVTSRKIGVPLPKMTRTKTEGPTPPELEAPK